MKMLFFTFILIFLSSCNRSLDNNDKFTPQPKELIENPKYADQIDLIDRERVEKELETLSDLIKQNRITKKDNGTKPIVVEIDRVRPKDDEVILDENGEPLIDPIHDKVEVEEYYVVDKDQTPPEEEPELIDLEPNPEQPIDLTPPEQPVDLQPEEPKDKIDLTPAEGEKDPAPLVPEPAEPVEKKEPIKEEPVEVDLAPKPDPEKPKKEEDKPSVEPEVKPAPEKIEEEKPEDIPPSLPKPKPDFEKGETDSTEKDKAEEEVKEKDTPVIEVNPAPIPVPRPKPRPDDLVTEKIEMKADWDERKDGPKFTKLTLKALDKHGENLLDTELTMKSGGYKRYCRKYNSLNKTERKQFWLMFISGLSRMESGFKPNRKYREGFKHKGEYVISRGLLQMSKASANQKAYGCGIKREQDLHDPEKNLNCAVKILNHWIKKDRRIYGLQKVTVNGKTKNDWFGAANYWSPIRLEQYSGRKKEKHERLGKMINKMSICR